MRDDYRSTSAVPSPHVRCWGFGSTSDTCIGIGYAMLPERFDLYLSTPRAVSEQMAVFASTLTDRNHSGQQARGGFQGLPVTASRSASRMLSPCLLTVEM